MVTIFLSYPYRYSPPPYPLFLYIYIPVTLFLPRLFSLTSQMFFRIIFFFLLYTVSIFLLLAPFFFPSISIEKIKKVLFIHVRHAISSFFRHVHIIFLFKKNGAFASIFWIFFKNNFFIFPLFLFYFFLMNLFNLLYAFIQYSFNEWYFLFFLSESLILLMINHRVFYVGKLLWIFFFFFPAFIHYYRENFDVYRLPIADFMMDRWKKGGIRLPEKKKNIYIVREKTYITGVNQSKDFPHAVRGMKKNKIHITLFGFVLWISPVFIYDLNCFFFFHDVRRLFSVLSLLLLLWLY